MPIKSDSMNILIAKTMGAVQFADYLRNHRLNETKRRKQRNQ